MRIDFSRGEPYGTRQVWKPPNSTAVYRTSAEVHIHLPYPYIPVGNTLHLNCSKFTNRSGLCFCVVVCTRLVIIDVNVEISLRFLPYNYLSPDRTLLKTLHKNGAPQAKKLRIHRSETSDSFRKLTQIVSKSKNFPPAAGSYGNYFRQKSAYGN